MKNCHQKPVKCYDWIAVHLQAGTVCLRCCVIFALLIGLVLCDCATACPQFGFGNGSRSGKRNQIPVGTGDATGRVWTSMSQAALKTEAILRQPPTAKLRNAETFQDAMDALQAMGLDVVLTSSASDDALTTDEAWEMIGNSNETGACLQRYLISRNAAYSVTQKGTIKFISRDEMKDEVYFQTMIYRVDHLVSNESELRALAEQIRNTLWTEDWSMGDGAGSASMQPRIQSGHRLLLVSIHYEQHVGLRQFLYELSVVGSGPTLSKSRSTAVEVGAVPETLSRLVDVPGKSDQTGQNYRDSMSDFRQMMKQNGGTF